MSYPLVNKFINVNNSGFQKFIKIATFPIKDDPASAADPTNMCIDLLAGNISKVYFPDNEGSIYYTNGSDSYRMLNPLTKSPLVNYGPPSTQGQLVQPGGDPTLAISRSVFYSVPFGFWIIDVRENTYDLYYNPIPRPEFINYVNDTKDGSDNLNDALSRYCKDAKFGKGTNNIALDPICRCLNFNYSNIDNIDTSNITCLNDIFRSEGTSKEIINTLKTSKNAAGLDSLSTALKCCGKFNLNCSINSNSIHPYYKFFSKDNTCPNSQNVTICNVSMDGTQTDATNIKQSCGGGGGGGGDISNNNIDCIGAWSNIDPKQCTLNNRLNQIYTITTEKKGLGKACEANDKDTREGPTECKYDPKDPPKDPPKESPNIVLFILFILLISFIIFLYFYLKKKNILPEGQPRNESIVSASS